MSEFHLLIETPWETRNLGIAAYALCDGKLDQLDEGKLASEMETLRRRHGDYFAFARLPKSHLQYVPLLQSCGFYLVECTIAPFIQFAKNGLLASFCDDRRKFIPKRFDSVNVKFVTATDTPPDKQLRSIAYESFNDDRFHLDFNCPAATADRRFENWVEELLHNNAVFFDLLKVNGETVGFMARKENHLILAGFSKKFQRSGLGDYLWLGSCKAVQSLGYRYTETLISVNNISVLNLYSRLGFKFRNPQYSFHYWEK